MTERETNWGIILIPPFALVVFAYGIIVESLLLAIIAILLAGILKVLYQIESSISSRQ